MSYITAIGTAVPAHRFKQSAIADFMVRAMQLDPEEAQRLRALYRATGIDFRHSVLADYGKNGDYEVYANSPGLQPAPTTAKRMELFRQYAIELSVQAVEDAWKERPAVQRHEITHLVVVSCTGMYAPGLDIDLVRRLGLRQDVQRTSINFMGCYAAFNALKLADTFDRAFPNAKTLVVCTELCSIHFQNANTQDNLLANALFADGSACLLVEHEPVAKMNLRPEAFQCNLALDGERDMAWAIGDMGFEMRLSMYVPDVIQKGIRDLATQLLKQVSSEVGQLSFFAIHPGGRRILEVIEQELELTTHDNRYSYSVLRQFGNMSSPTVLFVLKELWRDLTTTDRNKRILSFAFGPGLTLESMVLNVVPQ